MRNLTKEEQLKWYISFLEEQIKQIEQELNKCKRELNEIEEKSKVKKYSNIV